MTVTATKIDSSLKATKIDSSLKAAKISHHGHGLLRLQSFIITCSSSIYLFFLYI
jgi:hypothetical protein